MEFLLAPKNNCSYTANETEKPCHNKDIKHYASKGTSRFILYVDKKPVSVIQVMIRRDGFVVMQNAFTLEEHRRKKYLTTILNELRITYKNKKLVYSGSLSCDGQAFASSNKV